MPSALLSVIIAAAPLLSASTVIMEPDADTVSDAEAVAAAEQSPNTFETPRDLLIALADRDLVTTTLVGEIRYTMIEALANDMQMRQGNLAIKNSDNEDSTQSRKYAVKFNQLLIDERLEIIDEHFIFDGRWLVERLPEEKQFNKRALVPEGEILDPMALMRDAPFWVSLGRDQDRLLNSYEAELLSTEDGLTDNEDFPEIAALATLPHVAGTTQLKLTPKPGSGFEDDWEHVRIWVNPDSLLPALYIKQDWTGDIQIVELFGPKRNTDVPDSVFDTTTPDPRSGWRVQINEWRGDAESDNTTP